MLNKVKQILLSPVYNYNVKFLHYPNYFVLGHQKTGTSVIASLIAKRAGLKYKIDVNPHGYKNIFNLLNKKIDLDYFIKQNTDFFGFEVVKEPELTFIFEDLYKKFKNTSFIFVTRHPLDNIRSILDRVNISPKKLPMQFSEIKKQEIHFAWEKKLLGETISNNKGVNLPETLAYRWKIASNIYLSNSNNLLLCRYEDFQENKLKFIDNILNKLSIPPKNDISNLVDKQYQPKGENKNREITELFSEEIIRNIENVCSSEMEKLGYEFYSKK